MVELSIMREGCEYGYELVHKLLKMRQENGKPMSQYRIGQVVGVTDQAVYKWVKGHSLPIQENYDKLLEYEQFLTVINRIRPFGK